jgi:prepilin-type N-terminal cleavage/methylation domain-containing protein
MRRSEKQAFTLVEILIVVAIIGMLAAIAIPNFVRGRATAQKNACIGNLSQIAAAKENWAFENRKTEGASTAGSESAINAFLRGGDAPACQGGGTYTYGTIGAKPACSLAATAGHTL